MQIYPQLQQLLDVPATFRRPSQAYFQLMASIAAALTTATQAESALTDQELYQNAIAGWIDVWGDLAGINRRVSEADPVFSARIPEMLLAARDSAVAIETWLQTVEGIPGIGTVFEKVGTWGYTVYLPATLSTSRLVQVIHDLAWVRPAGMPFNAQAAAGATFLNTVNYFGANKPGIPWQGGRVTGAYLVFKSNLTTFSVPASTNNQVSLLPDLMLTDPTLNPNLASPLTEA